MTQPIDTAYVDIVARDKSLDKLRRDIDDTFDKIDKDIDQSLDQIDKRFEETFVEIDEHFKKMTIKTRRAFDDVEEQADSAFKRIRRRVMEPIQSGFQKVTDILSETGRVLGQLGSGIGSFASSSPLLILILALTPAIIALAAALSQLIGVVGLIPAGFAVALTAIIPVVVAFQNFGEAVAAFSDGDLEKINEALKKLSPSAASVAREIGAMLPNLRAFQRGVQEAFFAPLRGDFTRVFRTIFPTMEKGFIDVAAAMGRFASAFGDLMASTSTIQVFRELFATTVRIIDMLNPVFVRFADMLLNTVHEALPFVERITKAFGKALDAFSAFVNKSIETGDFDQFIEDAITTIKELIDLIKAVGGVVGTLFEGTEDSGHDFIQTLTDVFNQVNAFLQTEEGQKSIDLLILAVQALGATLLASANIFIFFGQSFATMMNFLEFVGRGFVSIMSTIIDWVTLAKDTLVNDFNNMVQLITNLPEIIKNLAPKFLSAGQKLIQSFMNGFRAVGSFVGDVAGDIVGAVKGFLNRAIDKINVGIARLDEFIPGDLGRIPRLAQGAFVSRRPGGILANIGEGREDEWILPQSKLEDIAQSSSQSITFGPGSISVNFSGAVPTTEEARRTGEAVGDGIASRLARRNLQVQVRAI